MGHIKGVLLGAFIINAGEYGRVRGQLTSSTLACYFGSKGIVQQRGREQPQKGERRKKITRLGTSTDNSQKSTNSQPLVVHNTHATPCSDSTRHMPPQCKWASFASNLEVAWTSMMLLQMAKKSTLEKITKGFVTSKDLQLQMHVHTHI